MKTIRTIEATNGTETRTLEVIEDAGRYLLHDTLDTNSDSLVELADDSDTSVADAIRDSGFEIVDEVINEKSEAYNTGYEAHVQGEDRTANPYPAGSWDAGNWFAGWDAAN